MALDPTTIPNLSKVLKRPRSPRPLWAELPSDGTPETSARAKRTFDGFTLCQRMRGLSSSL